MINFEELKILRRFETYIMKCGYDFINVFMIDSNYNYVKGYKIIDENKKEIGLLSKKRIIKEEKLWIENF